MKRLALAAVLVLLGAVAARPSQAQINSPPPALMGQPSYHLYSVSGVMGGGAVGTFFHCTNTTAANIRVGVEVFYKAGGGAINDPSASSLDLGPGAGALFGTSSTVWVGVDSLLGGGFSSGSARILATKRSGIICTAFLADPANAPPTSMADLKVVRKTKQKGD